MCVHDREGWKERGIQRFRQGIRERTREDLMCTAKTKCEKHDLQKNREREREREREDSRLPGLASQGVIIFSRECVIFVHVCSLS